MSDHQPAIAANALGKCADQKSVWLIAMQTFENCRAAETAFDRSMWMPAYHASNSGGPQIADHLDVEMERLTDLRCDAKDELIATPAPTIAAVIWKMEYAHVRWEDFVGWPDDWWAAVMSDLRRLAAKQEGL